MSVVKLHLPQILSFADYHEIDQFKDTLNIFVKNQKVKSYEVNPEHYGFEFNDYYCMQYYGLFYTNRLPTKQQIKSLLLEVALYEGWSQKTT
jgi:hypothetical protein